MSGQRRHRLGGFIRRHRELHGLTIKQLAKKSGVSKRALAALEIGEATDPRSSTIIALACTLGVSTDDMLGVSR